MTNRQVTAMNAISLPRSTRWRVPLLGAIFAALLVAILLIVEITAFVTRSETGARDRASVEFQRLCEKRCAEVRLTNQDFVGPRLSSETSRSYSYSWKAKQSSIEILVTVSYGPRWTESWLIRP
jgi:hypothetical protein